MSSNQRGGILKGVALFLTIILLVGMIAGVIWVGVESKGFKNWDAFKEQETQEDQGSGVEGDGSELESGTAYALPSSMVYSLTSAESDTASAGVTLVATVLPETAADKSVTWSVAFANAESEWATGKSAGDYITVTPDAGNSRHATVVCTEAFGEQIILTVASVSDPSKTATCTIDYAQRVESVTVKIGNVETVLGGNTEVTIDIGHNDVDRGGVITVEYTLSQVYTLAEEISTQVEFYNGGEGNSSGGKYFQASDPGSASGSYYRYIDNINEAAGKTIYFDQRIFSAYNMRTQSTNSNLQTTTTNFAECTVEELYALYNSEVYPLQNKVLWTMTASILGKYATKTVTSDIVWAAIDGWEAVETVSLDPTQIIFPVEEQAAGEAT